MNETDLQMHDNLANGQAVRAMTLHGLSTDEHSVQKVCVEFVHSGSSVQRNARLDLSCSRAGVGMMSRVVLSTQQ